jgi:hypothetical protein
LEEDPGFSHSEFSVSQNGVLVFQSLADSVSKLIWFDQSGKELSQIAQAGYRETAPLSRWAYPGDFFRRCPERKAFRPRARPGARYFHSPYRGSSDESPVWSHDGGKIAYRAFDGKSHYIKVISADGSSPPQVLVKGTAIMRHLDWSPDGHLVFLDLSNGPLLKVYSAADKQVEPLAPGAEARFSPDGKWIAYIAFTAGVSSIIVQPLSGS